MVTAPQPIAINTWRRATWEEFLTIAADPAYKNGRAYFDTDSMRIEMAALGAGHGRQNAVALDVITIFSALHNLRIAKFINCSFRKAGEQECQPDAAFYIGTDFQMPPQNNIPINIELFGPPNLVVEVGASSLSDDLGAKRLLYERLGIQEYWVINVKDHQVIAFSMSAGRSGRIQVSEVLPGLPISLVEAALQRSTTDDDGTITRWLLQVFA